MLKREMNMLEDEAVQDEAVVVRYDGE